MEIKDLKARMGNVDVTVTIAEKGQVREFEKFGKRGRVCTATAQDDTGKINLTLWNDDVEKVNAGDKAQLKNGYVGEYQGELQLSTGKFGELVVLEKGAQQPPQEKPKEKPSPQPEEEPSEAPFKEEEAVGNDDFDEE